MWICPICDTKNSENDNICKCCQAPRKSKSKPRKWVIPAVICAALLALVIGCVAAFGEHRAKGPAISSPARPPVSSASAVPVENKCGENAWWTFENGTLTIGGSGAMEDYYVDVRDPSTPWRNYYDDLKTVVIEDGITSIGDYAFYYCDNLTEITIPNSVTKIGEGAFFQCTGLTSITLPDSVTEISNYAFCGCDSLTSIALPDSVTKIGEWAFEFCYQLTILAPEGSYAQRYAEMNNIPFAAA